MFNFGKVLDVLPTGVAVARKGWAPGQCIMFVPGSEFPIEATRPLGIALGEDAVGHKVRYGAHIDLVTPNYEENGPPFLVTVWTPTQPDLLAEDWDYVRPAPSSSRNDGPSDGASQADPVQGESVAAVPSAA